MPSYFVQTVRSTLQKNHDVARCWGALVDGAPLWFEDMPFACRSDQ